MGVDMSGNITYNKLNRYHKVRYSFFKFLNRVGLQGFPSEYWEPASQDAADGFRRSGYRLTSKGWVKK